MHIIENYPLINNNTFHMDVHCRWFIEYDTVDELISLLSNDLLKDHFVLQIGGGSNLLFQKDFDGIILHSKIQFINKLKEDSDNVWIKVGSGVVWDDFCKYAVENNYAGVENLSFIPGEVGASAVQNIGAYGVEVADVIASIETVHKETGTVRIFDPLECHYGYRKSIFKEELKNQYIITSVTYKLNRKPDYKIEYGNLKDVLSKDNELSLAKIRNAVIEIRQNKLPDPSIWGNAGSFFMNPIIDKRKFELLKNEYPDIPCYIINDDSVKVPAGWLIERCGWKGKEWGGAAVHEKQCLVLINKNHATSKDVISLAKAICESVFKTFDIEIHAEVNYI